MLCNMAGGGEGNNNLRSFINIIKSLLCLLGTVFIKKKKKWGYFSGGPVAKTSHSQCREPGFDPWSGN